MQELEPEIFSYPKPISLNKEGNKYAFFLNYTF